MTRVLAIAAGGALGSVLRYGMPGFRGIAGFGRSGVMHSSRLLDLSLDLPIEFFDEPRKTESILSHLRDLIPPGHIVSWPAQLSDA